MTALNIKMIVLNNNVHKMNMMCKMTIVASVKYQSLKLTTKTYYVYLVFKYLRYTHKILKKNT